MTAKVCIVWAISAVALMISSVLASPSNNGSSSLTLPQMDVVAADDASSDEDQNEEPEEIED